MNNSGKVVTDKSRCTGIFEFDRFEYGVMKLAIVEISDRRMDIFSSDSSRRKAISRVQEMLNQSFKIPPEITAEELDVLYECANESIKALSQTVRHLKMIKGETAKMAAGIYKRNTQLTPGVVFAGKVALAYEDFHDLSLPQLCHIRDLRAALENGCTEFSLDDVEFIKDYISRVALYGHISPTPVETPELTQMFDNQSETREDPSIR